MNQVDKLYNEYNELKQNYLINSSLDKKEELKNKLIELDYEKSRNFGEDIDKKFPMTTTLDKEAKRLTDLINFIQDSVKQQKELINDFKKLTGTTIELSYLKSSDRLVDYKKRLEHVKTFLSIRKDLSNLIDSKEEKDKIKVKVLKNKLLKEEILNLLYEFCLIDSLEIKDINVKKIVSGEKQDIEDVKVELKPKKEIKVIKDKPSESSKKNNIINEIKKEETKNIKKEIVIPKEEILLTNNKDKKVEKIEDKKDSSKLEIKEKKKDLKAEVDKIINDIKEEIKLEDSKENKKEIKANKEELFEDIKEEVKVKEKDKDKVVKDTKAIIEEEIEKHEQKILTTMPIVEKIGSVVPVNVFEALKKTEEKIPDVVLPSNGLKDDQNDIFVETKDLFEESEKK